MGNVQPGTNNITTGSDLVESKNSIKPTVSTVSSPTVSTVSKSNIVEPPEHVWTTCDTCK